jgi:2'-5' RNA ligase
VLHQSIVLHRYFFALLPPPTLARRIAHAAAPWFTSGTQVRADRLHITMSILPDFPEVPRGLEGTLRDVGGKVASAPIAVTLDRVSAGTRSIALRPSRRIAALDALHRQIGAHSRALGVPLRPGYAFNAHMTLGYRDGAPFSRTVAPFAWTATELVLIHSHVGQTKHEVVARWPLADEPDPQLSLL